MLIPLLITILEQAACHEVLQANDGYVLELDGTRVEGVHALLPSFTTRKVEPVLKVLQSYQLRGKLCQTQLY